MTSDYIRGPAGTPCPVAMRILWPGLFSVKEDGSRPSTNYDRIAALTDPESCNPVEYEANNLRHGFRGEWFGNLVQWRELLGGGTMQKRTARLQSAGTRLFASLSEKPSWDEMRNLSYSLWDDSRLRMIYNIAEDAEDLLDDQGVRHFDSDYVLMTGLVTTRVGQARMGLETREYVKDNELSGLSSYASPGPTFFPPEMGMVNTRRVVKNKRWEPPFGEEYTMGNPEFPYVIPKPLKLYDSCHSYCALMLLKTGQTHFTRSASMTECPETFARQHPLSDGGWVPSLECFTDHPANFVLNCAKAHTAIADAFNTGQVPSPEYRRAIRDVFAQLRHAHMNDDNFNHAGSSVIGLQAVLEIACADGAFVVAGSFSYQMLIGMFVESWFPDVMKESPNLTLTNQRQLNIPPPNQVMVEPLIGTAETKHSVLIMKDQGAPNSSIHSPVFGFIQHVADDPNMTPKFKEYLNEEYPSHVRQAQNGQPMIAMANATLALCCVGETHQSIIGDFEFWTDYGKAFNLNFPALVQQAEAVGGPRWFDESHNLGKPSTVRSRSKLPDPHCQKPMAHTVHGLFRLQMIHCVDEDGTDTLEVMLAKLLEALTFRMTHKQSALRFVVIAFSIKEMLTYNTDLGVWILPEDIPTNFWGGLLSMIHCMKYSWGNRGAFPLTENHHNQPWYHEDMPGGRRNEKRLTNLITSIVRAIHGAGCQCYTMQHLTEGMTFTNMGELQATPNNVELRSTILSTLLYANSFQPDPSWLAHCQDYYLRLYNVFVRHLAELRDHLEKKTNHCTVDLDPLKHDQWLSVFFRDNIKMLAVLDHNIATLC